MAALGFPTYAPGTNAGTTYTLNGVTYTWSGYAWYKTNQGAIAATTITGGTILIGTGTQTINISGGNITIGGNSVITTATLGLIDLQFVTNNGSTTTNIVTFANDTNASSTDSGAVQVVGGVGIGQDLYVGGNITAQQSVTLGNVILDSITTSTSDNLQHVIDSYPVNQFRSAKYLVQIDDQSNNQFQITELLMLVANTGTGWYGTYLSEYGITTNAGELGTFYSQVNTGTNPPTAELAVQMYAGTYKTITVFRTGLAP